MSALLFKSTRSSNEQLKFSEAVVKGIASDGGLFVPMSIPQVNFMDDGLANLSYQDLAKKSSPYLLQTFLSRKLTSV